MRAWSITALVTILLACGATPATAARLSIACGSTGNEFVLCKQAAETWAKQTGNAVSFVSTPNNSSERLALYQQLLAAGDTSIDIFQIDIIWPGLLSRYLLDLSPYVPESLRKQHFRSLISTNTVNGKLVAMPWYTDAGLLYYRTDLLEKYRLSVPKTWQELTQAAHVIQEGERRAGNSRFAGFVWQGRAYEGLMCNALEWLASTGGGKIIADDGTVSVNNPQAAAALRMAAGWVGTISPRGVLNYAEEEARGVFQSGNAAFMRNWPYAWTLAQSDDSPVRSKVGVTKLPRSNGGLHTATLGGWQLAVAKQSRHTKEATDLVLYLTSAQEQKRRLIEGGFNPTLPALYKDAEVLASMPFLAQLYPVLINAAARPSNLTGKRYNQVSSAFVYTVHDILAGRRSAEEALSALEKRLERLRQDGRWGARHAS